VKVPFGTITITDKAKTLINRVLGTGRISCGKYVRQLEEQLADLIGVKETVAVSSGTAALTVALASIGGRYFPCKRDHEVVLPALSFAATGNAVVNAGLKPVFVDVKRDTLNIDPSLIEAAITPETIVILPVHLMGKPANMDVINAIAEGSGLYVIEDAAEAFGTSYRGRLAGSLGDMGAFSLYLAHALSTGEGGFVATDDSRYARVLRSLRSHGRACDCKVCTLNLGGGYCPKRFKGGPDPRFTFERIGYSCKMNELEAAIGLGNLAIYQETIAKRRRNLLHLKRNFDRFSPYLSTIKEGVGEEIGPHAFPIIVSEEAPFSREEFAYDLERNGIETRTLFSSMPTQCAGFSYLGYEEGQFPNAEYIGRQGLQIGIHQDLDIREMDYVLDTIERFLK